MASETARKKYPAQIVVMTTQKKRDRFVAEAEAKGVSIAEIVRNYLDAGVAFVDNVGQLNVAVEQVAEDIEESREALDPAERLRRGGK